MDEEPGVGRSGQSSGDRSRRIAVAATILGSLAAVLAPLFVQPSDDAAATATQLAAIYFGFLLTAQSVLFATAFTGTGRWPSMHDVSRATLFMDCILLGGVATSASILGTLLEWPPVSDASAFLWVVTDAVGTWTFVRLFSLATTEGRNRFLARTLARGLARDFGRRQTEQDPDARGVGPIVDAHRAAFAVSLSSDSAEARNLVAQLMHSGADESCYPQFVAAQVEMTSQTVRAVIARDLQPRIAADLLRALLAPPSGLRHRGHASMAVHASAVITRYATWASSVLHRLEHEGEVSHMTSAVLFEAFDDVRRDHLRWADPAPADAVDPADRQAPLRSPEDALLWYREFTSGLGSRSGGAVYVLYQALTGERYARNYADGAPVLADLLSAVHGEGHLTTPESQRTRNLFHHVDDLRFALVEALAGQLHDFRSVSGSGGPRRSARDLAADLAIMGSLPVTDRRTALERVADQLTEPADEWFRLRRAFEGQAASVTPAPRSAPTDRGGAIALVVALQLARSLQDPGQELPGFLSALPLDVAQDAHDIATEVLATAGVSSDRPARALADLVAAHPASPA